MPTVTDDAVRAHLGAILASSGFANADRISRFLQFTVEMKLRGEAGQIKEFLLGQEVFDRGKDYDPRLDPIVRVEARRLRQRLAEYYDGPGCADPLRIEFPKGSYAPVIQVASPAQPTRPIPWKLLAGIAAVLLAAVAIVILWPQRPLVAVIPARWVWANTAMLDESDEALAEQITAQFANQRREPVVGWPVVARFRGSGRDLRTLGQELGVKKIILVSVRRETGRMRVTLFHLDPATGEKGNVQEYFPESLEDYAARDQLAKEIAANSPFH